MNIGENEFGKLLDFMPEGWEAKAKELGALTRARNIKTPEELLKVVFLYITEGKSFAGASALIQLNGAIKLNKIAVYKWIRGCADRLQWICENIFRHTELLVEKPQWLAGKRVILVDASDYVLRLRANAFKIYDDQNHKINLIEQLNGLKAGEMRSLCVNYLKGGKYLPVRICATRKDQDSECAGLKRLKKTNRRKNNGKEVSKLQSDYNRYIIVATSLPQEFSATQVLEIYRMRWQIELEFKRLKSLFQYGEIPEANEPLARIIHCKNFNNHCVN